jgi:glycosyltransferase involved in cell wall biosynthesis
MRKESKTRSDGLVFELTGMERKPTIALCLEYPLALRGGVSVIVETLIEGLVDEFDCVLVSPDESIEAAGLSRGSTVRHIRWNPEDARSADASKSLAETLTAAGVKLAHFHFGGVFAWGVRTPGRSPILFATAMGIRVISSIHLVVSLLDGFCSTTKPLAFKIGYLPIAWLGKLQQLRAVKAEITVSEHDRAKMQKWYFPAARKIRRIYHSRLNESTQPPPLIREPFILSVGHVAFRKGQHVLAEAFSRIASRFPEWRLIIIGSFGDSSIERIREIASRSQLVERIQILGERRDVIDFMRRASIFVQPSRYEALGLALQEALWLGCPAIGCAVGGIPELICHGETGLLVAPDNPTEMAEALSKLMSQTKLRETFSRKASDSITRKKMTAAQMVQAHVELYREVLHGS